MKLRPEVQDPEVLPPQVWRQLKIGIHALGQQYGVNIEFPGEVQTVEELETKWWEAVGKYTNG